MARMGEPGPNLRTMLSALRTNPPAKILRLAGAGARLMWSDARQATKELPNYFAPDEEPPDTLH